MLSSVDEIKSKIDIVDLIREYIQLKPSGANFKALCPFHEEKTPSFMVSREKQFYHCFGCHESGDIFTFIQKMENVEFSEALKILANKAGVRLPDYNPQTSSLKTKLLQINQLAQEWFQRQLWEAAAAERARLYLKKQRALDEKTIHEWGLGYAPDSWDALGGFLRRKGYTREEIIQSGLVVTKPGRSEYYDRFRDRIVFPIDDYQGKVIAFTARAMKADEAAKYINSPQTLIYNKSEAVFGLFQAKAAIREADEAVVVEGNMDVISSHQAGIKNVVAVSGTAFTEEQVKIIQRLTNNFVFAFDADEAGRRAAERSISVAWQKEANVKVIALDAKAGKDPDEIIKHNPALWSEAIRSAQPAMDYFFSVYLKREKLSDINYKKQATAKLLNLIVKVNNLIEREAYLKQLAEKIEVDESVLREIIKKKKPDEYKRSPGQAQAVPAAAVGAGDDPTSHLRLKDWPEQKEAIAKLLLAAAIKEEDCFRFLEDREAEITWPASVERVYKELKLFYNEQQLERPAVDEYLAAALKDEVNLIRELEAINEEFFDLNLKDMLRETERLFTEFKKGEIRYKLKKISAAIRETEENLKSGFNQATKEKLDNLLLEYSRLSNQLKF